MIPGAEFCRVLDEWKLWWGRQKQRTKDDGGGGGEWEGWSNSLQLQSLFSKSYIESNEVLKWFCTIKEKPRGQSQHKETVAEKKLNRTRACRAAISPVRRSDGEMEMESKSEHRGGCDWAVIVAWSWEATFLETHRRLETALRFLKSLRSELMFFLRRSEVTAAGWEDDGKVQRTMMAAIMNSRGQVISIYGCV